MARWQFFGGWAPMLLLAAFCPLAGADEGSPPSEPFGLVGYAALGRNVTLTWQAPLDDGGAPVTAYHVYRSVVGEAAVLVGSATVQLYVDELPPAELPAVYEYVVAAVNEYGTSPQSNAAPVVTPFQDDCITIDVHEFPPVGIDPLGCL